jgi:hypothetical protein
MGGMIAALAKIRLKVRKCVRKSTIKKREDFGKYMITHSLTGIVGLMGQTLNSEYIVVRINSIPIIEMPQSILGAQGVFRFGFWSPEYFRFQ